MSQHGKHLLVQEEKIQGRAWALADERDMGLPLQGEMRGDGCATDASRGGRR